MKVVDVILILATILAAALSLWLVLVAPKGIGRLVSHDLVATLQQAHTEEEAGQIADNYAGAFSDAFRDLIVFATAPSLVVCGLWSVVAVARRGRRGRGG